MEQLNGFELAGKNIRLTVDDAEASVRPQSQHQQQSLESEDKMNLSSHGRLQLMAKLAEGGLLLRFMSFWIKRNGCNYDITFTVISF
jgi:hypothetical protein